MAVAIRLRPQNIAKVREALARRGRDLDKQLDPVARGITQVLLGMVQKRFAGAARGSPPAGWPPLSPFTRFVRKRRAAGATDDPRPLNDTGLLRNSNFPFVRDGGASFGVVNNVRYASTHQFGGFSTGGSVRIGGFERRSPGGGTHRVRPYMMRIGRHRVPARPFFPSEAEYQPVVMRAIRAYVKRAAGGPGA